jgi:hypothetical protein
MAQIAAKVVLKPAERNMELKAVRQRTRFNRALAGTLDGLVPLFKRRITVIGLRRVI